MAPEMMTNSRHYSTAVDVYSYGVMAAHVINGKLEYEGNPEFDSIYGSLTKRYKMILLAMVIMNYVYEMNRICNVGE